MFHQAEQGIAILTKPHINSVRATVVLGLGTLVSHGLGLSLAPAMLPRIEAEFQSGYGVLGLAVAAGLIAYSAGALITSKVMALISPRTLLIGTFLLAGAGFAVTALASSPLEVAVAVAVLGISAPISWTATLHMARETVSASSISMVSSGASGGSALGVIINGALVGATGWLFSWRVSFAVAAVIAAVAVGAAAWLFPPSIPRPGHSGAGLFKLFDTILREESGRLVVATSGICGVGVFTLATFATATAIDEMAVSAAAAAALLWAGGAAGLISAIAFGRLGDRKAPVYAAAIVASVYAATLAVLAVGWTYAFLLVALIGYGVVNGPIWGLIGAIANRRFDAAQAVDAVSLGLVMASLLGAAGNSLAGVWIDSTGSMRLPVAVLGVLVGGLGVYLGYESRLTLRSKTTVGGRT